MEFFFYGVRSRLSTEGRMSRAAALLSNSDDERRLRLRFGTWTLVVVVVSVTEGMASLPLWDTNPRQRLTSLVDSTLLWNIIN